MYRSYLRILFTFLFTFFMAVRRAPLLSHRVLGYVEVVVLVMFRSFSRDPPYQTPGAGRQSVDGVRAQALP